MPKLPTAATVLVSALVACGGQPLVQSQAPTTVIDVPSAEVHGPYVPAGGTLSVVLDRTLSTLHSLPGEPFAATSESSLKAPDGRVLVAQGAKLRGHVATAHDGDSPQLVLSFDTVQTPTGNAPIVAEILDVKEPPPPNSLARAERELLSSPPTPGPPSGVPITAPQPASTDVTLPAGAVLKLELTRPILPPGTIVGP